MAILKRHALTAATVLAAVVWFVALRPASLGGPATYVIVHGTSMTGTLNSGDLVMSSAQPHYSVGDVIVYHVPDGPGKGDLIVHRITGGDATGYVTKGDANSSPDPWRPAASDIAGKLTVRVPGFGQFFVLTHNPPVIGAIWGLVAFVLVFLLVPGGRTVWKYSKAFGLDHWPLAPNERPTWVTQTLYRTDQRGSGARAFQVWSGRDKAWLDLLAFDNSAGSAVWFGSPVIEFGDPMIVEATEAEVEAYIAYPGGVAKR
jgi:signal peptidase